VPGLLMLWRSLKVGLYALNFLSAGRKILLPKRFQTIASIPNAYPSRTRQKKYKAAVFFLSSPNPKINEALKIRFQNLD